MYVMCDKGITRRRGLFCYVLAIVGYILVIVR
jgi:hypothetical protein